MRRPGYEADRLVVMLRDLTTGRTTALTQDWDRSVTSIDWAHDSRSLYAIALDTQETPLWRIDARSGKVTRLTDNGTVSSLAVTASGAIEIGRASCRERVCQYV